MTDRPILEGAEPYSAQGDRRGALVLHGFTGCPQSMRPLAEAFAAAGYTVELPRLPGHGTTVEDMARYGWPDWAAAAEAAYTDLAARTDSVVVAGLSMGGTLTLYLAEQHPEIAAIVLVNPVVEPEDFAPLVKMARAQLDAGEPFIQGVGNDVADPDVTELAYTSMPNAAVLSLVVGLQALKADLATVRPPAWSCAVRRTTSCRRRRSSCWPSACLARTRSSNWSAASTSRPSTTTRTSSPNGPSRSPASKGGDPRGR